MKVGAHVEVREKPGEVVGGAGGSGTVVHGAAQRRGGAGAGGTTAQQPEINYAQPSDHIYRDLTRLEKALGMVADDPARTRVIVRWMAACYFATGVFLGGVVVAVAIMLALQ